MKNHLLGQTLVWLVCCIRVLAQEPAKVDPRALPQEMDKAWREGRLEEAEEKLFEITTMAINSRGADHKVSIVCREQLARLHLQMGWYQEAEAEIRDVILSRERTSGPDDKETLRCRLHLAHVLNIMGKRDEAEKEFQSLLLKCSQTFGSDDDLTLDVRGDFAECHRLQGRLAIAEQENRLLLEDITRLHGFDSVNALAVRNNLAVVLSEGHNYAKAEELHRGLLAFRLKSASSNQVAIARSYANIAYCLEPQGKLSEALEFARQAERIWTGSIGASHPDTIRIREQRTRLELAAKPAPSVPSQ